SLMVYGYGTQSHIKSTEFKQTQSDRAEFTKRYESGEIRFPAIQVPLMCTCPPRPYPHELQVCFIGGKERNKHEHKKLKAGRGSVGKTAVLGMRERGTGRTFAAPMEERSLQESTKRIHDNIEIGSQLYTDEHLIFSDLDGLFYRHDAVNHSAGEYAAGPAHTNGIESVWAVLKRG